MIDDIEESEVHQKCTSWQYSIVSAYPYRRMTYVRNMLVKKGLERM